MNQKYWAGNPIVERWGFKIAKILNMGFCCIIVVVFLFESLQEGGNALLNPHLLTKDCYVEHIFVCNFTWIFGLAVWALIYSVLFLFALVNPPKGVGKCILLCFWGTMGLVVFTDTWLYAWQPAQYRFPDVDWIYGQHIGKGLLEGVFCWIGWLQIYLPKRIRKYVIGLHTAVALIWFVLNAFNRDIG